MWCGVGVVRESEVSMRVPAGAEFEAPEDGNHFSAVFVLHKASRTIHIDDTVRRGHSTTTTRRTRGSEGGVCVCVCLSVR